MGGVTEAGRLQVTIRGSRTASPTCKHQILLPSHWSVIASPIDQVFCWCVDDSWYASKATFLYFHMLKLTQSLLPVDLLNICNPLESTLAWILMPSVKHSSFQLPAVVTWRIASHPPTAAAASSTLFGRRPSHDCASTHTLLQLKEVDNFEDEDDDDK